MGSTLLLAEPSVYGFGGGSSDVSTSSQNMIAKNKRTISSLKRQVSEQNERIDGLTSLIEGLNATIGEMQESRGGGSSRQGDNHVVLLKELGAMIDEINHNYVSKAELQKIMKSKGQYASLGKKKTTVNRSPESKSTSKLYSEGVRLFVKKRYDEAKKRFTITDAKGYKPAASNYYLGEIAYYTKKYEDAIFYFKKSAGLYDQASYIDVLLLHTAISLANSGDKEQARVFYENIIENYQDKKSAKIAKARLKKL